MKKLVKMLRFTSFCPTLACTIPGVFSRTQTVIDISFFLCNLCDVAVVAAMLHLLHVIATTLQRLQQCYRDCSDDAFVTCNPCNNRDIAEIAFNK